MLAITRREEESLVIYPSLNIDPNTTVAELFKGGPIEIIVTKIQGGQVRLGINAPKSLTIMRSELKYQDAPTQARENATGAD